MIYIAIGSNLKSKFGNRYFNIKKSISLLQKQKVLFNELSNFYETPSYPNKNYPKFLNVVARVNFKGNPYELLDIIIKIEKFMGRIRSVKMVQELVILIL